MSYDPYEPTHHWRYRQLYHTGYAGSTPPQPECPEFHEFPAILDEDTDEPGLCYRCEEIESLEAADEHMALAMIDEGPLAP